MSTKAEDLARWQTAKFWWKNHQAKTKLAELLAQLDESPDATFSVQIGINEHGHLAPWLCVEVPGEEYEGQNDLYPCPPRC